MKTVLETKQQLAEDLSELGFLPPGITVYSLRKVRGLNLIVNRLFTQCACSAAVTVCWRPRRRCHDIPATVVWCARLCALPCTRTSCGLCDHRHVTLFPSLCSLGS
jgi:hypothetical protein